MKPTFSTFGIPTMLFATLATSVGLLSSVPRVADNLEDSSYHPRTLDAMGVGSPCVGSEGAWFCMSSSFQRCASGQWSDVMQCAQGTVCQPEGLAYDLQSSSLSSSPSASTSTSTFGIVPVATSTSAAVVTPNSMTTTTSSLTGFTSGETTEMSSSDTTTASPTTTNEATTTTTTTSCSTGSSTTSCTTSTETSTAHAIESTGAPKNDTSGASRAISMGISWSLVGLACAAILAEGREFPL